MKPKKKSTGQGCLSTSDCSSDLYCSSSNICIQRGSCSATIDCPTGQKCSSNGLCVVNPQCKGDSECAPGKCINGFCTLPEEYPIKNCRSNNDCGPGFQCYNSRCIPYICNMDAECSGSSKCIQMLCQKKYCTSANDCLETEACLANKCETTGQNCTSGKDCTAGLQCRSAKCIQCVDQTVCKLGESCVGGICRNNCARFSCAPRNVCVDGINCCPTDPSCGKLCTNTRDCSGTCSNCVNGYCTCIKGKINDVCKSSSDCGDGLECLNGVCYYLNSVCTKPIGDPMCNQLLPYCVNGYCSASVNGMKCVAGQCGSLYCVNGKCQNNKGLYGDECTKDLDCGNQLKCTNIMRKNICYPVNKTLVINTVHGPFYMDYNDDVVGNSNINR